MKYIVIICDPIENRVWEHKMALNNFVLIVAGTSVIVLLCRSDVKQLATILRRNAKHIKK